MKFIIDWVRKIHNKEVKVYSVPVFAEETEKQEEPEKKEAPKSVSESDNEYQNRLKRYPSGPGIQFVIETPAGTNDVLKIKPGVKIAIDRSKMAGYLKSEATARN